MKKFKLFMENFLVYGLGDIISRIIPLIMVPIITRIMPSSEYFGISDLSNTVISLASALAILGIYDAMYRLFFEREDNLYKITVCSTAFVFTCCSSFAVFIIMIFSRSGIAKFFFGSRELAYIVYISATATLVSANKSIIAAPTRMQNKRKVFLVTNTVSPILSYLIAIPMLLNGYYTIALPLAALISGITMGVSFYIMNRAWFKIRYFDKKILKQLIIIAIPLFPNFIIYWLFNSSDKVMITNLLNIGEAGIYVVGSKLGHASQLIYTAFAGGWQFFAFSTMKEKNQVETNSKIFEYLGVISFIATAFICVFSFPIYSFLFTEEYVRGYIIAPYLFLAPLLQMLFQVEANQFIVIKKTWPNMLILIYGALLNIILNFVLIPIIGIEGASIATLVGYISADIICTVVLVKMKLMILNSRFCISTLIMVAFMLSWRLFFDKSFVIGILFAFLMTLSLVFLYREDVKRLVIMIKNKR